MVVISRTSCAQSQHALAEQDLFAPQIPWRVAARQSKRQAAEFTHQIERHADHRKWIDPCRGGLLRSLRRARYSDRVTSVQPVRTLASKVSPYLGSAI